jgi:hypothetical protein
MNIIEAASLQDISELPEKLVNQQFSVIKIVGQGETVISMQEPTFVSMLMVKGKNLAVNMVSPFKVLDKPSVTLKRLYQKGTNKLTVKYDDSEKLEAYLLLELQSAVRNTAKETVLPSLAAQAVNFGKAAVKHVKTGLKHADADTLKKRIETCEICEYRLEKRCKKCGCYLGSKQKWESSRCPDRRW